MPAHPEEAAARLAAVDERLAAIDERLAQIRQRLQSIDQALAAPAQPVLGGVLGARLDNWLAAYNRRAPAATPTLSSLS